MATKHQNLSDYDPASMPDVELVSQQRYAVVVADWNANVTFALLEGAVDGLRENGVLEENLEVLHVPGAFELTYAAKELQAQNFDAIIVLGCVIQGDTPHFDYVCSGVTQGITALNLTKPQTPVIFGVLTVNTLEQALDRCGGIHGNKGVEAAITAIKMANLFAQ